MIPLSSIYKRKIKTLQDVIDWGLCIGCGACFYACRKKAVTLVNVESVGIRPMLNHHLCGECTECVSICPGYQTDTSSMPRESDLPSPEEDEIGYTLEIREGYASAPETRYRASSGGLLSALSLYCLEQEGMSFVLHIGMNPERPWENTTFQSRTREEILQKTGSRYAPASPCDGLEAIEKSDTPCVFIGKPCDVAGVSMARRQRSQLDKNLGLVLSFFCAGTPSTQGTLKVLEALNTRKGDLKQLRYRGNGWPGHFTPVKRDGSVPGTYTYEESWNRLNQFRDFRCHLCPDGLGRMADLSCGDSWHEYANNGTPGSSIILVRTPRGREILHRAMAAGYVTLKPLAASEVIRAQTSLLSRRRVLFGRLLAMRMLGIPIPRFTGFALLRSWMRIPLRERFRSIAGTLHRLIQRGRWHRRPLCEQRKSQSEQTENLLKEQES
ncbi:MAG: Coenzyme F420 hydrogenase/dehydrogenase, beta subunit C-terminal domain [bacterium]|jgi:coenzyme F420 hydrogenase subunit beta